MSEDRFGGSVRELEDKSEGWVVVVVVVVGTGGGEAGTRDQ